MKKGKNNKNHNYRFNVYQIETTEGLQWYVEYPDISAVVGGGNTPEEAITEARNNLNAYIEYLENEGLALPVVTKYENEYSGKVTLRMSYSLHKKVAELSELEGVSINSYINEALIEKTQNSISEKSCMQIISENASKLKKKASSFILEGINNYETNNYNSENNYMQNYIVKSQNLA